MKKKYELEGMSCAGCVSNVKTALMQIPGVKEAEVQLIPQRVVLTLSEPTDVQELQNQLSNVGNYTIKEVTNH